MSVSIKVWNIMLFIYAPYLNIAELRIWDLDAAHKEPMPLYIVLCQCYFAKTQWPEQINTNYAWNNHT